MPKDNQAGATGLQTAGEAPASVGGHTFDDALGMRASAPAAPPPPKPFTYLGIERIENGFVIRGHGETFGADPATRVAYSPAEAGAAVAELLKRHMAEADLKGQPEYAVLRFENAGFSLGDVLTASAAAAADAVKAANRTKAAAKPKAAKAPANAKPAAAKKPAAKKPAPKA